MEEREDGSLHRTKYVVLLEVNFVSSWCKQTVEGTVRVTRASIYECLIY